MKKADRSLRSRSENRASLRSARMLGDILRAVNGEGLRPLGSRVLPDDSVASETQRADGGSLSLNQDRSTIVLWNKL